jgi:hypothetical protein
MIEQQRSMRGHTPTETEKPRGKFSSMTYTMIDMAMQHLRWLKTANNYINVLSTHGHKFAKKTRTSEL